MQKTKNYNLGKPTDEDFYNVNVFNDNADIIDAELKEISTKTDDTMTVSNQHIENKSNPHAVNKENVGLGNVPNVTTNDQTPTYTVATSIVSLTSGEKLSVAFGKIAKAISSLISHLSNTNNPHSVTKSQVGLGNVDNKSSATIRGELTSSNVTSALGYTPINQLLKGVAKGVAELDEGGKVPSSQLPSFVDDVLEYTTKSSFPTSGETGKIYVDVSTNLSYRWGGSDYVEISPSLALGETSSTAYRGDRGKTAYTHSQKTSGNPHKVTKSDVGLSNVDNTSDTDKPISTATQNALNAINDTLSGIGVTYSTDTSGLSTTANTDAYVYGDNITLEEGTYIIIASAGVSGNTEGIRRVGIRNTTANANVGVTSLNSIYYTAMECTRVVTIPKGTTYKFAPMISSGVALSNWSTSIKAVKII